MLDFYFDLNACGKLYAHQRINDLLGRLDDVDKTLVRTHFKLLTAILVLVYRTENGYDLLIGRKRDRTGNCCAVSLCYLNDLLCCCINESVVVALQSYSDLFLDCHLFLPPVSICLDLAYAYIIDVRRLRISAGAQPSTLSRVFLFYPFKNPKALAKHLTAGGFG